VLYYLVFSIFIAVTRDIQYKPENLMHCCRLHLKCWNYSLMKVMKL